MVYSEGMPKQQSSSRQAHALTVNQVVSYNLGRARRSRGWTQEETAERLERASGKKWTAATLSASERAIKTGRPRVFDANELITFARVFEYPVAYFFLPIEGKDGEQFFYLLSRPSEQPPEEEVGAQREPLLETLDLLYAVIPLKYPAAVVDAVNRLLQSRGVVWQPYSDVTWDDGGQDDFDTWRALNQGGGSPEVTLDEWKTITEFAALMKRLPASRVYRLVADAMENSASTESPTSIDDPPF